MEKDIDRQGRFRIKSQEGEGHGSLPPIRPQRLVQMTHEAVLHVAKGKVQRNTPETQIYPGVIFFKLKKGL